MTSYQDMSAAELRDELEVWRRQVSRLAREMLDARDSGDEVWESGMAVALRQALAQEKRIERLLQLGVAA